MHAGLRAGGSRDGLNRYDVITFDCYGTLITAQQVRSYKPAPGHFETARRRIGRSRWLHAAQSRFHDVVPCRALGIPVVWVNHKSEPARPDVHPDIEARTLGELAERLETAGQASCL